MLSDIKIRYKLLLLLVIPLFGLVVFSAREVVEKYATMGDIAATRSMTVLAVKAGALVHEIQKERGLSSGYLNSQGAKFRDELARQRKLVDQELTNVKQYAAANAQALEAVKPSLDAADSTITKLRETRGSVDSLNIVDAINEVTMQVHQIATAAEEQTAVTGEISTNIHQITDVVHDTARGAHETATAASQLSSLARDLQSLVGRFKLA